MKTCLTRTIVQLDVAYALRDVTREKIEVVLSKMGLADEVLPGQLELRSAT